jgi:hypothetical protein
MIDLCLAYGVFNFGSVKEKQTSIAEVLKQYP